MIKWGFFTGSLYIIYYIIIFFSGIESNIFAHWGLYLILVTLITILTFISIFFGVKELYVSFSNNKISITQGFLLGFKISFIGSVIAGLFTIFYKEWIDPNYSLRIMQSIIENLKEKNIEMDVSELMNKDSILNNVIVSGILTTIEHIFAGLLKAFLAAIIVKKIYFKSTF